MTTLATVVVYEL